MTEMRETLARKVDDQLVRTICFGYPPNRRGGVLTEEALYPRNRYLSLHEMMRRATIT